MQDMILEGKNDFCSDAPPYKGLSQVQLGVANSSQVYLIGSAKIS